MLPFFLWVPTTQLEGFAMSNNFSLDDLNQAIDTQYAPFGFTANGYTYSLRQVLRLAKSERSAVVARLKDLDVMSDTDPDEDVILEIMEGILSVVTADYRGAELVQLLGHDIIRVKMLLEKWIEASQAGEASPSPA